MHKVAAIMITVHQINPLILLTEDLEKVKEVQQEQVVQVS
jgi:hypothetical protein